MPARSIHATLTRHFLRRFLENDLIAPDADRSQLLAIAGAALFSVTLLVTVFMSFQYVMAVRTPSQLALAALSDKHFYLSLSMIVSALLAVVQWDSLVVDVRDAAILEPLPVRPTVIRRAKLAAVAILGAAAAVIVNLMPTLVFPWLLVYHTRVPARSMLVLIVVHALVTMAAAGFAYVVIVVLREMLAALFPARWLSVLSPIVQSALIVLLGSALLLTPAASTRIAQRGFSTPRMAAPPMWFLGVYEVGAGAIVRFAPRPAALRTRAIAAESLAAAAYDRRAPQFALLARRAAIGSGLVVLLGVASYASNARRFPSAPIVRGRRRRWHAGERLVQRLIVRGQTARAGFFFTLAATWRSGLHRLTLACAGSASVAAAVVILSGLDLETVSSTTTVPGAVFAIQPLFYGALIVAFRHAIRVPAELRANWGFQLAWRNRHRDFLKGVRRAALAGIVVPALLVVLPLYGYLLGMPVAIAHAMLGFAGAAVLLEVLLLSYDRVPFTCTYIPTENLRVFGIPYTVAFLIGAAIFAAMERAALQDAIAWQRVVGLLAAMITILRWASRHGSTRPPVDFNEAPVTTQQLGLHS